MGLAGLGEADISEREARLRRGGRGSGGCGARSTGWAPGLSAGRREVPGETPVIS